MFFFGARKRRYLVRTPYGCMVMGNILGMSRLRPHPGKPGLGTSLDMTDVRDLVFTRRPPLCRVADTSECVYPSSSKAGSSPEVGMTISSRDQTLVL